MKRAREHFQQHARAWIVWLTIGCTAVLALLIGPTIVLFFRNLRLARKPRLRPHSAATIWYNRALKLLAKRGMRKKSTQTADEFLKTVRVVPVRQQLQQFTEHYKRARFGDSAQDAEKLPDLYRELELTTKSSD
ncbi:MAG: DUF4129 domain-containing protein [Acidobacteria bacterium]|nr:DUF4129 domain-containing protein [Acidobacteriota bacterium]